jgi:hypothetical protein
MDHNKRKPPGGTRAAAATLQTISGQENTRAAWAVKYAHLGWRVHPCRPGEKLPLLDGWPKRATTDFTLIDRWWGRTPDANVAIATGPASGIFVLDVDGPEGERSLTDLQHRHGPLPEGRTISNSAGRLGPKLDTRVVTCRRCPVRVSIRRARALYARSSVRAGAGSHQSPASLKHTGGRVQC